MPFPKNFQTTVKLIFKRLFRVYAHMYYSHFQKVVSLNEEAHLNTSFKVRPAGWMTVLERIQLMRGPAQVPATHFLFCSTLSISCKSLTSLTRRSLRRSAS